MYQEEMVQRQETKPDRDRKTTSLEEIAKFINQRKTLRDCIVKRN